MDVGSDDDNIGVDKGGVPVGNGMAAYSGGQSGISKNLQFGNQDK